MNISLTPKLDDFVGSRVSSGRYHSTNEVVREGLRLLEMRQLETEAIQNALNEVHNSSSSLGKEAMDRIRQNLNLASKYNIRQKSRRRPHPQLLKT